MANISSMGPNGLTMLITLVKQALTGKVDTDGSKVLSTNDYTTEEKNKLSGVAAGATANVVENTLTSDSSENALAAAQGKALNQKISDLSDSLSSLGYGDMLKSSYDTDGDGVVDNAAKLGGVAAADYAKAADVPTALSALTNDSGFQTAAQVESAITAKGYQTADQVDGKVAAALTSALKAAGSVSYSDLPTLDAAHLGYVYNVTDAFTTDARFREGAGNSYPVGTNVAVVAGDTDGTYLFDVMAGFVDLSAYQLSADISELSNEEISTIWNSVTV